jgi:hypothetical protein
VNVDDDAAHRGCQIVSRPDGIIAFEERFGVAQGVWIKQQLVAVEPKPFAVEILWPIDTVGIMSARPEASDKDVPEKERGFELDDLDWLDVVVPLKQKQLDGRGIPGEDREIYSLLIDRCT